MTELEQIEQLTSRFCRKIPTTKQYTDRLAEEVEISFDNSDEDSPFIVKNVRARLKNCPYVECSTALDNFIEYPNKLMVYTKRV